MRQWLLIRGAMMAIHYYEEASRHVEESASIARSGTGPLQSRPGSCGGLHQAELPPPLLAKIINGAHTTTEVIHLLEFFEDVFPHVAAEVLKKVGPVAGILGAVVTPIANLREIAEAHEIGDRQAEINAFIWGFASQLVFDKIVNQLPSNAVLGQKQILENLAGRRLLAALAPDAREKFLKTIPGGHISWGLSL
jgi:hypothetical protein